MTVRQLQRGDPEHLVTEAGRGTLEIRELLGGQQHADAGLAAAGQQRQHVVGAECRELVERDRRRHRCAAAGSLQAAACRTGQILDRECPDLGRELAVGGCVQREQHDVAALQGRAEIDARAHAPRGTGRRRLQIRTCDGLAQQREPRPEPGGGAELVGRQRRQVIGRPARQRRRCASRQRRQPRRRHHRDHLTQRRWALGVHRRQHGQRGLQVAFGGTLIVRLGESLGRHQAVLEGGRTAVCERIPMGLPVRSPDGQPSTRGGGRRSELGRKRGRAFHVDRHERSPARDLLGEDRLKRRRLAGPAGADDQRVRFELAVRQRDSAASVVAAEHDRRRIGPPRPAAARPASDRDGATAGHRHEECQHAPRRRRQQRGRQQGEAGQPPRGQDRHRLTDSIALVRAAPRLRMRLGAVPGSRSPDHRNSWT